MKISSAAFALLSTIALTCAVTPAFADADDAAWIKRCVSDNSDQNQAPTVIASYCACMNGKMSSSETASITAWEKKHPAENAACSKEAGWK